MKTKDFIKMLQDADPSGEAHIRWGEGVPTHAVLKEGYWDGPFSYINEDGQYVDSIEGMKVDIYSTYPNDIISEEIDYNWNSYLDPIDGLWDKVKERFKFEYGGYANESQRMEREERFLREPKEHFDWWVDHQKKSWDKHLIEVKENARRGWRFYQVKDSIDNYYDWIIFDENGIEHGANAATTYPILKSGKFKKLENNIKETSIRSKSYWKKLLKSMGSINGIDKRLNKDKIFVEWVLI